MKTKEKIIKAVTADGAAIKSLVDVNAQRGLMLPCSLFWIYENIRNFWLIKAENRVIGCAALQVCWEDLAEIRSLAVEETKRKEGWGRLLVEKCLEEAAALGLGRVFTLTFIPEFFKKLGFSGIDKKELPHKIWKDCFNCPHFPNCREVAMLYRIDKNNQ